jgi:hypothetical protein
MSSYIYYFTSLRTTTAYKQTFPGILLELGVEVTTWPMKKLTSIASVFYEESSSLTIHSGQ